MTLGVYYLHAARRCGLKADGVDFPNHFLLRVETAEGPVALDPFSQGRLVLPSELTRRALRAGLTPDVADRLDTLMAPVSDRQVLLRLQNMLFVRAIQSGDFECAERSALRRALLDPNDHRPWLDVAAAREGQGALAGALEALGRAQQLDGGAAARRPHRPRPRPPAAELTRLDPSPLAGEGSAIPERKRRSMAEDGGSRSRYAGSGSTRSAARRPSVLRRGLASASPGSGTAGVHRPRRRKGSHGLIEIPSFPLAPPSALHRIA